MLGDIVLGLPILCLLGSILYCGVCLWKTYQKPIHIRAHRIIERIGIWKTGMGRWRSLALSSGLYVVSAVLSVIISVLSSKSEDLVFTWTQDLNEYITPTLFALITMILSLSMYGVDFSKITKRINYLCEKVLVSIVPIIIWIGFGIGTYKDLFSKEIPEWLSSTGSVFQLFFGIASLLIMMVAAYKSYKDLWVQGSETI